MEPSKENITPLGIILSILGLSLILTFRTGAIFLGSLILLFGMFFTVIPFLSLINTGANRFKNWLKGQEKQELHHFDLEILAAETDMEFAIFDREWEALIKDATLGIKLNLFYPSNFFFAQKVKNELLVFRHELFGSNDSGFIGLAVKLGYQIVPTIALVHHSIIEEVEFYRLDTQELNYQSLPANQFPRWLSSKRYSLFYVAENKEEVVDFLAKNEILSKVTQESSARLICLNGKNVCVFFRKFFKANLFSIRYQKSLAFSMLDLRGKYPDLK